MLNLHTTICEKSILESGEIKIRGMASTPSTDRARDIILAEAWAKGGIDSYRKNPILLFNHNYNEPIGKVTNIQITDSGLEVEGLVFEGSKSYALVKNGVLKTFSVGFLIKDADYNKANDGLIVKDAELLEISVVSVPCNQDATFELSKGFSDEKFEELKKQFGKETDEGASASDDNPEMTKEEIEQMIKDFAAQSRNDDVDVAAEVQKALEAKAAEEKRLADEAAAEEEKAKKISARVEETVAEKIEKAVAEALEKNSPEGAEEIKKMSESIKEQAEELKALREARGGFFPESKGGREKWIKDPVLGKKAVEAFILAKATGKSINDIDMGKEVLEKVNTQSSVQVSSDAYEQEVTTQLQEDIEQDLVIAPLFQEIQLRSASQLLPIMPDTGYATHQTSGSTLPGTKPNGLLNHADGSQPYTLSETTLRTDKLVSKVYLANDTDEDVLIPLLPLLRDRMTRQHAKSVDQMILTAGVAGGVYPGMANKGLAAYAATNGRSVAGPSLGASETVAGANLLDARINMGKYGLNPSDIVYIVSTDAYFNLLKDKDFYNNDEVGTGTKVTGEVGRMFGSRIIVSGELSNTVAAGEIAAYALNVRNFVIPRLRGFTYEAEYTVDSQAWLMATTQRLGFSEIIPDAKSVTALTYAV